MVKALGDRRKGSLSAGATEAKQFASSSCTCWVAWDWDTNFEGTVRVLGIDALVLGSSSPTVSRGQMGLFALTGVEALRLNDSVHC